MSAEEERFEYGDLVAVVRREDGDAQWRLIVNTDTPRLQKGDRATQLVAAELVIQAAQVVVDRNRKPVRQSPTDQAITAEVRTLIADRGWLDREAAEAFGMSAAKLSSRLCGYNAWQLQDLLDIGRGFDMEAAEALEHFAFTIEIAA